MFRNLLCSAAPFIPPARPLAAVEFFWMNASAFAMTSAYDFAFRRISDPEFANGPVPPAEAATAAPPAEPPRVDTVADACIC